MDEQAPDIRSLKALRAAEAACTRCPLYKNAIQVVPGEGPARARILMVGEQPGDQEDKQGHPFVGPAGIVQRRLHRRPNAYEIDRCHWWLDVERKLVKPRIMVALGVTAVRSVSGRPLAINKIRGRVIDLDDGGRMLATIHPSYILRIEDEADKRAQYRHFVADLKVCVKMLPAA